ncbi:MAG: outer membrane protein assembly factor BamB [Verrucomicrobiales bacterium]|jgi:outer membrane protein assembly factor BamB
MKPTSLFLLCLASLSTAAFAGDWPEFRGPNNDGQSTETGLPTEWGPDKNIVWKTALPAGSESNGSPIVSNCRVFLTSAEKSEGKTRTLHCFDHKTGEELWMRDIKVEQIWETHKTNLYGGSTPASDGKSVVVWHQSAGLICYDFEGNEIWNRNLGGFKHMWGYGASPIIDQGRVILHAGPGPNVFMTSIDLKTGETQWKTDEPVSGNGERNPKNKYMGSWSTPVIANDLIVCSFATRVNGYDPATGKIVWSCDGLIGPKGDLAYTSPVIAGDVCVAMGGFGGPAFGFKMSGEGNITESARLWREEKSPQRIGSGVYVGKHVYIANAGPALFQCIDPATGESAWEERAPGAAHWGSMIHADGRLYVTDQQGTTHVIKPNPEKLELLASNRLGERSNSTPAFSDGQIFIRTFGNIYCIGVD